MGNGKERNGRKALKQILKEKGGEREQKTGSRLSSHRDVDGEGNRRLKEESVKVDLL